EPVAIDVSVCPCAIAAPEQAPACVAPCSAKLAPLPVASCAIVTDWCASSVTLTGVPFLATVEPSTLTFCVTQAVFELLAPVACWVIDAVDEADCVRPDALVALS